MRIISPFAGDSGNTDGIARGARFAMLPTPLTYLTRLTFWKSNGQQPSVHAFGLSPPEVSVYADGATMFAYPAMNGDKLSLSTSTLMIDGFPLAAARLMAGTISSGSVTFSP